MAVIGFNFDSIQAEKTNKIQGKVNIKYNVGIKSLTKEKVDISSQDEVIKFNFEYKVEYQPNIGHITLKGHTLFLESKKKVKEIIDTWEKQNKIHAEIMEKVINSVLEKCTIKALNIESDLNLPPHMKLPKIKSKKS
tara:strand:+ start:847 stop:1257 length:411 start_codon:yes stop_codon:yes gene_type:complete